MRDFIIDALNEINRVADDIADAPCISGPVEELLIRYLEGRRDALESVLNFMDRSDESETDESAETPEETQNPVTENCKSLISELEAAYNASCAEHNSELQELLLEWGKSEEAFLKHYTELLEQED